MSGHAAPARYSTITVCAKECDHTTLQAVLDAAQPGDTIELGAEVFREGVNVLVDVTIRGAGSDRTVVDASGLNRVVFNNSADLTLTDTTIRGGQGGVINRDGRLTLDRCVIRDNNNSGVSSFSGGSVVITRNLITNNTAFGGGGVFSYGIWRSPTAP